MEIVICPECGAKVSTEVEGCPSCGYPVRKMYNKNKSLFRVYQETPLESTEDTSKCTKTCPECGEVVSATAEKCPRCGYPFKTTSVCNPPVVKPIPTESTIPTGKTAESSNTICPQYENEADASSNECPDYVLPSNTIPSQHPAPSSQVSSIQQSNPASVASNKDAKNKAPITTILLIVGVLLLAGGVAGWFYRTNIYLPAKRDAEAPRYYVMSQSLKMRSTPEFEAEYNKIATFPYGTEIIVYDSVKNGLNYYFHGKYAPKDARGKVMKDKVAEGYLAGNYLCSKADFFLLNSIFGNEDARKMLSETRYRRALLEYFKNKRYRGDISTSQMQEYGISDRYASAQRWQVVCKYEKATSNNVYRSRKYRKDSKYTDLAVIIQNMDNGERRLLYFVFDDDETHHLIAEQSAPRSGYMKDRTLKLNMTDQGYYRVEVEYVNE